MSHSISFFPNYKIIFGITTLISWVVWFPLDVLKGTEKVLFFPRVCSKALRRETVVGIQNEPIDPLVYVDFLSHLLIDFRQSSQRTFSQLLYALNEASGVHPALLFLVTAMKSTSGNVNTALDHKWLPFLPTLSPLPSLLRTLSKLTMVIIILVHALKF